MKAEIYFIKDGGFLAQDIDAQLQLITKALSYADVEVVYKTMVENSVENLNEAFLETKQSREKIDLVVTIGGLYNSGDSVIRQYFKKEGISLDWKKLPQSVQLLYSEPGKLPGFAIKLDQRDLIVLPNMREETANIITTYVVPYLVRQEEIKPKQEKKKNHFFRNIFPHKGDDTKEVFRKITMIASLVVFLGCAVALLNIWVFQPMSSDKLNNEIRSTYYKTTSNSSSIDDNGVLKKFYGVLGVNQDIKGWIYIPHSKIDYPVLQPPKNDPEYYLYRDYEKQETKYGSIFADAACDISTDTKNILLHGHHMQDGRMFADLVKYSDMTFYQHSPVITFDTLYEEAKWKIISVFKTNTREDQGEIFNYLRAQFANKSDFLNFVYDIKMRSIIDTPVDVNEDDRLITLSTCSYEFDDFRTVVVARKVREAESAEVEVAKAKLAENPLMPDCWYRKNGGTPPKTTSFEQAYSEGSIDWYYDQGQK